MLAKTNIETVLMFLKYGACMIGLLLLIYVLAVITPKIAKLVDGLMAKAKKSPERVDEEPKDVEAENYEVKGPYDAQIESEFDKNDKIYNQDIYGFPNKSDRSK